MPRLNVSSLAGFASTLLGVALFALIGIGIRLLVMMTVQQRRERQNRQINERLRVLIAAYKTLGGSFTGQLSVDPSHLRDQRRDDSDVAPGESGSDRTRRIRDAVEAALSDIFLLGTEEQVRLAGRAASELVAGHPVQTHDLVVSLRAFIREALDLNAVPADLALPNQGPTRPASAGSRGRGGGNDDGASGRGGRGGGSAGGGGMGMGMGAAIGGAGLSAGESASTTAADPLDVRPG